MAALLVLLLPLLQDPAPRYEPTWESLATRPTPDWFEDARFGIFIHWGVYSVPAFCDPSTYSEWYRWWLDTNAHGGLERRFHEQNYGADFAYEDFAPKFRAELWDPDEWAEIFRRAGARYVVLTSKHHDGFALWPSAEASAARGFPWNAAEVGPHRDLVGELTEAVRAAGLRMGLYYSVLEWHNPIFDRDLEEYVRKVMFPQMKDIVRRYRPDVFWCDGEWERPAEVWHSTEFLAWLYNEAPNRDAVVANDRWGRGLRGRCGDFATTEYGRGPDGRTIGDRPWEECRGIGHSFAFNRAEGYDIYLEREECVRLLLDLASRGGNLLLDIGPTADGRIPLIMVDRLLAMGRWLDVNGESVYGTRRSPFRSMPWGAATTRGDTLYLHLYEWPKDGWFQVPGLLNTVRRATLLHDPERRPLPLVPATGAEGPRIDLRGFHPFFAASVVALELDGPPRVDERIRPDADGVVRLRPEQAELTGPELRVETVQEDGRAVPNLGWWSSTEATAAWEFVLPASDTGYRFEILYGCAPCQEGGRLHWRLESAGGASADLEVEIEQATGSWQSYRWLPVMDLGPTAAEDSWRLVLQAAEIQDQALMNIREIRVSRVP
ncbi:MAG: hypothetical protein D6702_09010 [Planctomycetota bacterium]|nr:MAG: hypothetical protein D6702_09010 [Planctomycetota bacterium]